MGDRIYLPEEPSFENEPEAGPSSRRPSTSTIASRRQSAFDHQRIDRRSRPTSSHSQAAEFHPARSRPASIASRATSKSRAKRYSSGHQYQLPDDARQVGAADFEPLPQPLPTPREDRPLLEQSRVSTPARNFSQRNPVSGRVSTATRDGEEPARPATALPPVPQSAHSSQPTSRRSPPNRSPEAGAGADPDDGLIEKDHASRSSRIRTELSTISYLIFFAIWGTLARLGLQWMTFYPGTPLVTPVAWANLGGSFVLGFLAENQSLFKAAAQDRLATEKPENWEDKEDREELMQQKKAIPLYIGLTVGFCGCFTSFSAFARDMFFALSNDLPTPNNHPYDPTPLPGYAATRQNGYSVEALLAVIFTTLALSVGGFITGSHSASAVDRFTPTVPLTVLRKILDPAILLLGVGSWIGALLLTIFPPDRFSSSAETWRGEALFAILFAPAGCLLRHYSSRWLNALVAAFPLGTFAVNLFGSAVEAMCYDIQHVGVGVMGFTGGGLIGCQVLQGVQDGFCGSLTTVSTFVAEIRALKRSHAYFYAIFSVSSALCLMVVIMGSVKWSVGFGTTVCATGYTSKVNG